MPCRRDITILLKRLFSGEATDSTSYFRLTDLKWGTDLDSKEVEGILTVLQDQLGLIRLESFGFTACRYKHIRGGQSNLAKSTSVIDKAIATHSTKSGGWYDLRLQGTGMQSTGFDYSQVVGRLRELADCGQIKLHPRKAMSTARILLHPEPNSGSSNIEAIVELIYKDRQRKFEDWTRSRRQVVELFTKDRCTLVGIAEHFGTELPDGRSRCGRCDWCLTGKPLVLQSELDEEAIDPGKVRAVLKAVPDRDHPRFLARIAAGLPSPRVTDRNLHKSSVYGSMRDSNFDVSLLSVRPISPKRYCRQ